MHSFTVELDDTTVRRLAIFGKPTDVLARLAHSAADTLGDSGQERREQTNESLRVERHKADAPVVEDEASAAPSLETPKRGRARATIEREATDKDLGSERAFSDSVVVDQREANARMVNATIRAHELTEEAEEARKCAENSERGLREVAELREMFIAILGHDLRTPLGSISMAAGLLLQRGNLDDGDAQTVARIIRSSQRISRMVAQLLDLTRARLGGGLPIDPKPTDLRELCQNVVEEFDAPIHLDIDGDVAGAWDAERVAEVLSNVVGNAVEYAAPGTTVLVKAYAEGAQVVVETTNEGEPIPPDQLPFIFEPFRRARPRATSKAGNLGLGLYIAHEAVIAHGGTLTARSVDGRTTFVVRLPRLAS